MSTQLTFRLQAGHGGNRSPVTTTRGIWQLQVVT